MLLKISNNDFIFIGLAVLGLLIFGFVIFSVLTKSNKGTLKNEDIEDDNDDDYFPEIKPTTKEGQEAKDELQRVFNQMANDLENNKEMTIEQFEQEQEENAIISYKELMKQAEEKKLLKNMPEKTVVHDLDIEKPKNKSRYKEEYEEIEKDYEPRYREKPKYEKLEVKIDMPKKKDLEEKTIEESKQMQLELEDIKEPEKKFKNSEIISPIFGIQGSPSYKKPIMKADENAKHAYNQRRRSSEENQEFLRSLKAFRNNL